MFAKEVIAITWYSFSTTGKSERSFKSLYAFDDGFDSEKACLTKLTELRYNTNHFSTVYFCKQWYAANMTNYKNFVVVTAENIIYSPGPFSGTILTIPMAKAKDAPLPKTQPFDPGSKMWAAGIKKDLYKIDDNAVVKFGGIEMTQSGIIANNVLVTFGREFFKTEICIRTDAYTDKVFSHYYSPNSLCYILDKVNTARSAGYEYYNPFTGDVSRSKAESNKKKQLLLQKCGPEEETKPMKTIDAQGSIALDSQFIRLIKSGKTLYMRTSNTNKYYVDQVIGVKETWRPGRQGAEYIAETDETDPSMWCMSNSMPPHFIKRYVRVKNITKYSLDEYDELPFAYKETTYNRIPFYIDGVDYERPLRQAGYAKPPGKPFYIIEFEPIEGFDDVLSLRKEVKYAILQKNYPTYS